MKCSKCGNVFETGIFCPECGTKCDSGLAAQGQSQNQNMQMGMNNQNVQQAQNNQIPLQQYNFQNQQSKPKGAVLVLIMSIIMLIWGAIQIFSVVSSIGGITQGAYYFDYSVSGLLTANMISGFVAAATMIISGILGIVFSSKKSKAVLLIVLGIIVLTSSIISSAFGMGFNLSLGGGISGSEIFFMIVDIVIVGLFFLGAIMNKAKSSRN